MTRHLMDFTTGEVLAEFSDDDIIRIYHPTNLERKKIGNKLFFKLFKDTLLIFTDKDIHFSVYRTFFKLIKFMSFDNEFLSFNGLLLNLQSISEICDIKISTLKNHIRKLEKIEVLRRIKNGRNVNILINPYFIAYGRDNTSEAIEIFSKSIWAKCSTYSKSRK